MIRVLIVDDEQLARERILTLLENHRDIKLVGEARNGTEAVAMINEKNPDLVFLDIQMPGLTGVEVVKEVKADPPPEYVFVTAYDQYTLDAFATHAIDYLLKPFDNERFHEMLNYARQRIGDKTRQDGLDNRIKTLLNELSGSEKISYVERIPLRQNQSIRFVEVKDLISCEAEGSYVRLITRSGHHLIRENLGNLEKRLDPSVFFRIHRSTLVRISAIEELQSWTPHEWMAKLSNGKKYVVSRKNRDKLKSVLKL